MGFIFVVSRVGLVAVVLVDKRAGSKLNALPGLISWPQASLALKAFFAVTALAAFVVSGTAEEMALWVVESFNSFDEPFFIPY